MAQLLLQDLAAANEQRVRSKKERDRLRKQLKCKRFDGFTFVQRRIALSYTLWEISTSDLLCSTS